MNKKVSLVLSGGGARGIAHIGVIEELEHQGYHIHSIAGTSMGALVGGVYASGKLEEFKKWLYTIDKFKMFRHLDFTFNKQGLLKGDKILDSLEDFITDKPIEDLKINYTAVAVNIAKGSEVVFTKGSLYKAIRASIAIPTIFTPQKSEHGLLVDGGILNNLPVSHAHRIKNDFLIACDVCSIIPFTKKKEKDFVPSTNEEKHVSSILDRFKNVFTSPSPQSKDEPGYFELIIKTIDLMINRVNQQNLAQHPPDLLINISSEFAEMFEFYRAEELVNYGRERTREALKEM